MIGDTAGRPVPAGGAARRPDDRFPDQPAVYHPADYVLTAADLAEAAEGRAVFIRGRVVKTMEWVAKAVCPDEVIWFFVSRGGPLITDLAIPRQEISSCACVVDAREIIALGRSLRRQGLEVCAAGHSHALWGTFTSATDWEEHHTLLVDAARVSTFTERVEAVVSPGDGAAPGLRISLPDGSVSVELSAPGLEPAHAKAAAAFLIRRRRAVSTFATSTAQEAPTHIFPALEATYCDCGARRERRIPPSSVTVHVVGPIPKRLPPQEEERLAAELKEKTARRWSGYACGQGQGWDGSQAWQPRHGELAPTALSRPDALTPYTIYRAGAWQGTVSAELMEALASREPELRRALGWDLPGGRP